MNQILAQGAEELIIALQTPAPRGHTGVPVLLWGRPGVGKTSFVESLANDDFPVTTLIASIHDPTDFSGLPLHVEGRTSFAPPEWSFHFDGMHGGILFLDELTTAPPSVQAALLRVVLERRVGPRELPPQVRIVAAANPPDTIVGGWELSPPLANRFVHLDWDLTGGQYCDALRDGFAQPRLPVIDPEQHREQCVYWRMMTEAFLRQSPSLVYAEQGDGEYAFATPRTWDFAIALMASCDLLGKGVRVGEREQEEGRYGTFVSLVRGCVGLGPAKTLLSFLLGMRIPEPEGVLDGEIPVAVGSLQDDELYVLFTSLASALARRKGKRSVDSLLRLLDLVEAVNKARRVDTIFAPVRQVVRGQQIQRSLAAAHEAGRLPQLQARLEIVFRNTPLAEYIQLLGTKRDDLNE